MTTYRCTPEDEVLCLLDAFLSVPAWRQHYENCPYVSDADCWHMILTALFELPRSEQRRGLLACEAHNVSPVGIADIVRRYL
jgi:hypothetical protein